MTEVETAAGLAVRTGIDVDGATAARDQLIREDAAGLLAAKDPTLWGTQAEAEASIRLGWVDTFHRSRALLPRLAELTQRCAGLDHVVLAGMGGSSLAPEVIARTLGVELTVLDTTDPHQVKAALADRIDRTVLVVASKSGSTVETDAQRRAYVQAFTDAGITDVGRHIVVVTDPGSPLEAIGDELGAAVILADPHVGGRYSALTAFGLVPAALAGVDVAELLEQAESFAKSLSNGHANPTLTVAATLAAAASRGRDKVALIDDGTGISGLGDWAEQLIAESTGKEGTGILPVVVETPTAPGATGPDVLTVTIGGSLPPAVMPGGGADPHLSVNGPLGAQFFLWEAATALAGRLLLINPFDQPNVAESKDNTARILDGGEPASTPLFVDGAVEVHGGPEIAGATTVAEALTRLLGQVPDHGYLAIMAYLDRFGDAPAADVRAPLAAASGAAVTFGWGPRFLHSTGQYHKGGPANGAFLQITGVVTDDVAVPGRPYGFGGLQRAQAAGDREALGGRGRPLLWLHLTDRAQGVAQLVTAAKTVAANADTAGSSSPDAGTEARP